MAELLPGPLAAPNMEALGMDARAILV